jgi:hypothetical protein
MSVLPPKRDWVLLDDSDAVPADLVALQQFEPTTGWHSEIVQPTRRVNQSQLPLDAAPQFARDASSRAGVPFTKQIGCRVVGERLNHTRLHTTRIACNSQASDRHALADYYADLLHVVFSKWRVRNSRLSQGRVS